MEAVTAGCAEIEESCRDAVMEAVHALISRSLGLTPPATGVAFNTLTIAGAGPHQRGVSDQGASAMDSHRSETVVFAGPGDLSRHLVLRGIDATRLAAALFAQGL